MSTNSLLHSDIKYFSSPSIDVLSYSSLNPLPVSDLIARENPLHIWAVLWSLALSQPIFVRLFVISLSPLRIRIEHWVTSSTNFNHTSYSKNIYYFTPCSESRCLQQHKAVSCDSSMARHCFMLL